MLNDVAGFLPAFPKKAKKVKLHVELVALDDAAPEPALFLMPEDGGI